MPFEPVFVDLLQRGYVAVPISHGKSSATVWRLVSAHAPTLYVKSIQNARSPVLLREKQRYEWLQRFVPVPKVIAYDRIDNSERLVLSEVAGVPAFDASLSRDQVILRLAEGLRMLHAIPIAECPFDMRLETRIAMAKDNAAHGRVDLNDLQPEHRGWSAEMLLAEVHRRRPVTEDLVVSHGDYCLPNVILSEDASTLSGIIDIGYCGIADRYQDLALAWRSIRYNFGEEYVEPFFDAYNLKPDFEKIAFYNLLDELF